MTKRDVATLVFKALGAYVVIFSIVALLGSLISLLGMGSLDDSGVPSWVFPFTLMGPYAVALLLSGWLWFSATQLAEGVFPDSEAQQPHIQATTRQWLSVGFALVGLYFIAVALPELWGIIVYHLSLGRSAEVSELLRAAGPSPVVELSGRAATKLVEIIVGVGLVASAWRITPGIIRGDSDEEAPE